MNDCLFCRIVARQSPADVAGSLLGAGADVVGMNCGRGPDRAIAIIREMRAATDAPLIAYPNAGLPNAFGQYDESPEETAALVAEFARSGFLNIVGGCCGTTPAHIKAVAEAVKGLRPRQWHALPPALRLSGMEAASFM